MKRLSTRLVMSHLAVAVVAVLTSYLVVRGWAPALFDQSVNRPGSPGGGASGMGRGLRAQVGAAITRAAVVGSLVGTVVATVVGVGLAWRLVRPLSQVRDATRAIARGSYDAPLPRPGTTELAELADDVRALGQSLAHTEQRRVRLLGDVAHEMRTPLTVIEGRVEAMVDGLIPLDPDALAAIGAETRRLRRLADDLSLLSRSDEGRVEYAFVEGDLAPLVREAAERLRPQCEDAGITLQVDVKPAQGRWDPDRMAQLVTNLVGNAIAATPSGGRITVTCHRDAGPARARTVLRVDDTGRGIAADDLPHVFERFHRGASARRDGGSGIGLTIARDIATAHGGTIEAHSPGFAGGASLVVRLP